MYLFQIGDIYPDTVSDVPATTAKEWMQGRNVQPNMMSMQTGHAVDAANIIVVPSAKKLCTVNSNITTTTTTTTDSNKILTNGNNGITDGQLHSTKLIQSNPSVGKEAKLLPNGNNNNEECNKENDNKYDNNSKKFAFLAQQTIPDYRPQTVSSF